MDFCFRDEDEAFRLEVRAFLDQELPPGWGKEKWIGGTGHLFHEFHEFEDQMRAKLAQKGWLAMAWPKEHGGGGADVLRQTVFTEEMEYRRSPGKDSQGIGMVGPCLMAHGTEEQKAQHLAPIARAEEAWAQGFSEPEAGSDLAGLQTRAVRDGDDFVINGQKIWTSHASKANWLHVLTRTNPDAPKHKGISYFMVPMDSPGLLVRPIESLVENHDFNEVFFDDVRVPATNMIGEENLGWYVATTTLNFERSNIGSSAYLRGILEDVIAVLRTMGNGHGSPLESTVVRHKLADLAVGIQVSRTLAYRTAWLQQRGEIIAKESSLGKLYASELFVKFAATVMELFGLAGQIRHNEPGAPLAGGAENLYLGSLAMTIGGGTSEIQRNVIAQRGLGLPR
jgi:alkylation response protein AidB-like acyl-CoA dehydrogenase